MRKSCLAILFSALVALPAAAQEREYHAVVLTVGGDAPEQLAREARQAVAVALERDGVRVLPEGDLALRMPPARLSGCDSMACAWSLGRELRVSMVAAVATWQSEGRAGSITVSLIVGEERAYPATEEVGERTIAATAAAAVRGAQNARARGLAAEASAEPPAAYAEAVSESDSGAASDSETEAASASASATDAAGERSIEEWVLPGVLGVVGLAFIAGGVYALLPEQCELTGASGVCLRGNGPNIGLGVLFTVVGGLSAAGALLWLIIGGEPADMGPIDVVLGPTGGGLRWRATF